MLCKFHFKKQLIFPSSPYSFLIQCAHSWSIIRGSVPVPDDTHFRDPHTVHLFCANALRVSAKRALLPEGKQLHAHLIKFGFCHVLSLQNQILSVYLKCKEADNAEKLFEELPVRNVVSWNILIHGIVGCGNGIENYSNLRLCFSYFKRMLLEMVVPDSTTFNGLFGVCVKFHDIGMGFQLHCFAVKLGLDLDCFVGSVLVDLYAKYGLVENARRVFQFVLPRDLVMWNVMISGYALNCLPEEALDMFNFMRSDGANGDEFTFSSLLSICDTFEYYDFGRQVHSHILKQSFDSDVLVAGALINMYAKNENINDARRLFDRILIRNTVAWNTIIVGCGICGEGNVVMKLLREMLRGGFFPDELTISSTISSCGYASAITETMQAHAFSVKSSFQEFLSVTNSLISAYSKCGSISNACKCFRLTRESDLVTWTTLINAYAFHGLAKEAIEVFENMLSCGIIPDRISFLGVLSACSHCGLVTKGLHYFNIMTSVYQIVPDSGHYTCLVDLLGRYGLLNEAFEFLRSMPMEAESNTLGAFIGSCNLHANIGLAKWAAEKLFTIEPEKNVNYAVMSNIYASHRHWCDVERVRRIMGNKSDARVPGCSWIEIRNQVHSFVSNDRTHPKALETYATLKCMKNLPKFSNLKLAGPNRPGLRLHTTAVSNASNASRAGSQRERGSNQGTSISSYNTVQGKEPGIVKFTMEEIFRVTRKFSPAFKIGQGGFGAVYKAKLLDGTIVAVKRAKKSLYEKHLGVEFQSEIQTLSRVEHLNLVKFFGYLEQEDERIIVVEYVPNGTLREHLDCIHGIVLDLAARLDIAIDVAHAITYLHMYIDRPIIHRDIKSSNILLTENFRAKVADFGFARQAPDSDSGMTHVSTQVKGTAGYLDPEYLKTYQLTEKSDVYSFGVLLVELVTGRRPIEPKFELRERITAKWAMKRFIEGDAISVLDPRLDPIAANSLALEKILELALQCLAPRRQNRPTMKRCAEILWCIRKDFREQLSASNFRSFSTSSQRSTPMKE